MIRRQTPTSDRSLAFTWGTKLHPIWNREQGQEAPRPLGVDAV